jgi:nicotinamide phosphoribosyltransferase
VLDPHIGLIYGDSITLERAEAILGGLKQKGFCSTNVVFGIGSYTYQYITRDTFGWAVKATAGHINGKPVAIQKDPITDKGSKKSACGFLRVDKKDGNFVLEQNVSFEETLNGEMKLVFFNGGLCRFQTLSSIRQELAASA